MNLANAESQAIAATQNTKSIDIALAAKEKEQILQLQKINQEIEALTQSLKLIQLSKPNVATPQMPKTIQNLLPLDREAMNSPIFVPGGAPISDQSNNPYSQQTSVDKSTENSDNPYLNKDQNSEQDQKIANDTLSSGSNSSYSNPYNNTNYGGYYPISSTSSSTKFQATLKAVNSKGYVYGIAKENNAFIDPFANISSDNAINLRIIGSSSGTSPTYTSIKFCNQNYVNCGSALTMSSNATNLSTDQLTGGSSSYALTSITVDGKASNYQIARLYAQITNSVNTTTNISFSFPISSCQSAQNSDLICMLSVSGATVSVANN